MRPTALRYVVARQLHFYRGPAVLALADDLDSHLVELAKRNSDLKEVLRSLHFSTNEYLENFPKWVFQELQRT
jgi:hypothetical protein